MTQSQTQNQNLTEGLNRIRRWRDQYRSMQPPSPLEDVNQLAAKLEMTHAHPSGIAQLFASGHVRLDSLFRDTGVLKAAERHIGRVLDDQAAKREDFRRGGVVARGRRGHMEGQRAAGAVVPGERHDRG